MPSVTLVLIRGELIMLCDILRTLAALKAATSANARQIAQSGAARSITDADASSGRPRSKGQTSHPGPCQRGLQVTPSAN